MEEFKEIEDYPNYSISNLGNVYSKFLKRNLILVDRGNGYLFVTLCKNNKKKNVLIHRLVGLYFVENKKCLTEIDHLDGNKKNNISTNLKWVTHVENMNNPITKIVRQNAIIAKQGLKISVFFGNDFVGNYNSLSEVSRKYDLHCTEISKFFKGKRENVQGYTFKKL